jgi:hypothetical protein
MYHFYILVSFAAVAVFIGGPVLGQALTPVRSGSKKAEATVIVFYAILTFAYMGWGVNMVNRFIWHYDLCFAEQTGGRIVELGETRHKGGRTQWAVYEYRVDDNLYRSAARNDSLNYQPGLMVKVAYAPCWPRYSMIGPALPERDGR